jgi:hypothetical protein
MISFLLICAHLQTCFVPLFLQDRGIVEGKGAVCTMSGTWCQGWFPHNIKLCEETERFCICLHIGEQMAMLGDMMCIEFQNLNFA